MTEISDTALATQSSGFLKLVNQDTAQIIAEELNGLELTFDRVKMPSSGSTVFEVPGEDGELEAVKEFSGVIIHHHPLLSYYATKYTGGNHPPDCGSYDAVVGQGHPGGKCEICKNNHFGTGDNDGKACKTRHRLYILREGEIFPILFNVPPQSVRMLTNYIKRLLTQGKRPVMVVTEFTLQKATNKGNMLYSQARFKEGRELTPEEQAVIMQLSDQVKARSLQVAIDDDQLVDAGQEYPFIDPETGEIIR